MNEDSADKLVVVSLPFKTELDLINGTHKNDNNHPSIIHFSFNKAATQHVKSVLIKCAIENGMTQVGINDYAFNTTFPFLDHLAAEDMKKYRHIFKPHGYLYSVFGGMVEGIAELDRYKIVFAVRDPRDMLVSSYYSQALSHIVPDAMGNKHAGFMARREFAQSSTIDEYVIRESDKLNATFLKYSSLLLQKYPHVHVARYEDMIDNFSDWLRKLLDYCQLSISPELFASMVAENEEARPADEDFGRHVRKGVAGDYLEKLQLETVKFLNDKFAPMLAKFAYPS